MELIVIPILKAIIGILNFYQLVIFVNILLGWLVMFGIIDPYKHKIVMNIFMFTRAVTEPIYAQVRRFLPNFGPLDFSPIVVILGIYVLSAVLSEIIFKLTVVSF